MEEEQQQTQLQKYHCSATTVHFHSPVSSWSSTTSSQSSSFRSSCAADSVLIAADWESETKLKR